MKFKESELAHKYCIGKGIELGPATHNPFNLKDCMFVSPKDRIEFWNESQVACGEEYTKIDMWGDAENIPVKDHSIDYIVSSHVIEHVPNPIAAFIEWDRVLVKHGIVFMIFPKRTADPNDVGRELSILEAFKSQFVDPQPLNDHEKHIWVFNMQSMVNLISFCNVSKKINWQIVEQRETDDKTGDGHLLVLKKRGA